MHRLHDPFFRSFRNLIDRKRVFFVYSKALCKLYESLGIFLVLLDRSAENIQAEREMCFVLPCFDLDAIPSLFYDKPV